MSKAVVGECYIEKKGDSIRIFKILAIDLDEDDYLKLKVKTVYLENHNDDFEGYLVGLGCMREAFEKNYQRVNKDKLMVEIL